MEYLMTRYALPLDAFLALGGSQEGDPLPIVVFTEAIGDEAHPPLRGAMLGHYNVGGLWVARVAWLPGTVETVPASRLSLVLPESSAPLCRALARHKGHHLIGGEVPRREWEAGMWALSVRTSCSGRGSDRRVWWERSLDETFTPAPPPANLSYASSEARGLAHTALWGARLARLRATVTEQDIEAAAEAGEPDPRVFDWLYADEDPLGAMAYTEECLGLPTWSVQEVTCG